MARKLRWIGLALLGISLTGCVSQEKYTAVKLQVDDLTQRLAASETDSSTARAERDAYKAQLDQVRANGGNYTALLTNQQQQIADLTSQNSELNQKLADAIAKQGTYQAGPLPAALSSALTDFASANSDLVDFDAARGTVKFKSDVLFPPGSAILTSNAREAISRFSRILNSSAASGYELMVCGHTDSTPVVNVSTIRAGNLNNWYLSAHRAISVGTELIASHVSARRIAVVGYADQRPVASNATESGKAQNRRVEVLILPTTVQASAPPVASAASYDDSAPVRPQMIAPAPQASQFNKDSSAASTDETPAMRGNK
jgi:chemotaxis protein MotB